MAEAVLSVEITGKIDNLRDAFNRAIRETNGFDKDTRAKLASIDKGFANLSNDIDKSMGRVASSTSRASSTIQQSLAKSALISSTSGTAISAGSNRAAYALQNLGRVAQDAPFGFIGIQNNLNPLLESFQQLRKETGSNAGALKALGSSLIGPAGLGIALSLVGAAILFYQQYQQRAKKSTEEATKATADYKDTLTGLNKVIFEGATSSGEESSRLDLLFRSTQNLSLSVKDRTKAVKELQDKYPNYFKNLTVENALTLTASENYKKLKKEIVATSLARAADKDTAKQGEVIFENLSKRAEAQKEINKLTAENSKIKQDLTPANSRFNAQQRATNEKAISNLTEETKKYDLALKNANTSIFNNSELQDAIVRKFGIQAVVTDKAREATAKYNRVKTQAIDIDAILSQQTKAGKEIKSKVVPIIQKLIDDSLGDKPIIVAVPIQVDLVNPEVTSDFGIGFLKSLEDFTSNVKDNIAPLISDTFVSLGAALNSGDFSNVGQNILKGIAGFLGQFGQLLIKEGTVNILAGIAKNLILPGSGANQIAGGIGLVAAGGTVAVGSGLLGSSSSGGGGKSGYKIPGFATGVTGFGGGLAMVGERGPELVNLPTGSNVITNENTMSILGNRQSTINIVGESVQRGGDIYTVWKKAEKEAKRI